ncbi:unnamed protein product [Amoebophrya sp. A25]|nr:unnamed protein product [Amoebophrya sp. A25]|eukprot:GSA25T00011313001.1
MGSEGSSSVLDVDSTAATQRGRNYSGSSLDLISPAVDKEDDVQTLLWALQRVLAAAGKESMILALQRHCENLDPINPGGSAEASDVPEPQKTTAKKSAAPVEKQGCTIARPRERETENSVKAVLAASTMRTFYVDAFLTLTSTGSDAAGSLLSQVDWLDNAPGVPAVSVDAIPPLTTLFAAHHPFEIRALLKCFSPALKTIRPGNTDEEAKTGNTVASSEVQGKGIAVTVLGALLASTLTRSRRLDLSASDTADMAEADAEEIAQLRDLYSFCAKYLVPLSQSCFAQRDGLTSATADGVDPLKFASGQHSAHANGMMLEQSSLEETFAQKKTSSREPSFILQRQCLRALSAFFLVLREHADVQVDNLFSGFATADCFSVLHLALLPEHGALVLDATDALARFLSALAAQVRSAECVEATLYPSGTSTPRSGRAGRGELSPRNRNRGQEEEKKGNTATNHNPLYQDLNTLYGTAESVDFLDQVMSGKKKGGKRALSKELDIIDANLLHGSTAKADSALGLNHEQRVAVKSMSQWLRGCLENLGPLIDRSDVRARARALDLVAGICDYLIARRKQIGPSASELPTSKMNEDCSQELATLVRIWSIRCCILLDDSATMSRAAAVQCFDRCRAYLSLDANENRVDCIALWNCRDLVEHSERFVAPHMLEMYTALCSLSASASASAPSREAASTAVAMASTPSRSNGTFGGSSRSPVSQDLDDLFAPAPKRGNDDVFAPANQIDQRGPQGKQDVAAVSASPERKREPQQKDPISLVAEMSEHLKLCRQHLQIVSSEKTKGSTKNQEITADWKASSEAYHLPPSAAYCALLTLEAAGALLSSGKVQQEVEEIRSLCEQQAAQICQMLLQLATRSHVPVRTRILAVLGWFLEKS